MSESLSARSTRHIPPLVLRAVQLTVILWFTFFTLRSALALIIPRDLFTYGIGGIAAVLALALAKHLPARPALGLTASYAGYLILQFLARGNFEKLQLITLSQYVFPISFAVLGYVLWVKKAHEKIIWLLVLLISVSCFAGLLNHYTGFAPEIFLLNVFDRAEVAGEVLNRAGSLAGGSIITGLAAALAALLVTSLPRGFWVVLPLLIVSLVATLSRGGMVVFLVGLPVTLWLRLPQDPVRRRVEGRRASGLLLGVMVILGAAMALSGKGEGGAPAARLLGDLLDFKEEGNAARLASWLNAIDIWSQSPLFGNGTGILGATGVIEQRMAGRNALAAESMYLQILGELGAVGLVLYGLALLLLFGDAFTGLLSRKRSPGRSLASAEFGCAIAIAAGGLFLQNLSDFTGSLFWFFIGGLLGYRSETQSGETVAHSSSDA